MPGWQGSYVTHCLVYPGCRTKDILKNDIDIEIKNAISLQDFKDRPKTWDGPCDSSKWN